MIKHSMILITLLFVVLFCAGCAGMITKWECTSGECIPRERATNKCLAQANAAFAPASVKSSIWQQCMRGEGFERIPCEKHEFNDSKCQLVHVF